MLISFVCSKPYLLGPSIAFLNLLCRPKNLFLFDVNRNKPLRWLLKNLLYRQFCTGENSVEVKRTMDELRDLGFKGTILTYAKETTFNQSTQSANGFGVSSEEENAVSGVCSNIEAWRQGTLNTVRMLGQGDQLALKLTGAGPVANEAFTAGELAPQQLMDALEEICSMCRDRGVQVLVDAESQHYQAGIARTAVDLMRRYNRGTENHAVVFTTYQAYLKSTPATLRFHMAAALDEGFTLGLKLVRGAYMGTDKRSLIHDTKADTDAAYDDIAASVLRRSVGEFGTSRAFPSVELLLAGHNMGSIEAAHRLHRQRTRDGLPTVPVAFAQLHGMADRVSLELLRMGGADGQRPSVYKCSTWGTMDECLAYLARRATENRDAASRTRDEYLALKGEARSRVAAMIYGRSFA
ncbi:hypothetical protein N3K66_006325 [Trichothecium roseum]|uniref:Uncharacterized protein n=1 Tax=Trichothecium roseum TaxID=47278 RepID=A0ACC0UUZ8_9HYPO|nr:hypothetical protein N3K66_006325 [Trichothecium roseum]